ncbi:MAG: T9SS type A sorting domain-containing protein [Candidatus Delongbacteria bacterium]|nr:T9SS type A sorting domain-containing protein [Candidatus Delongbacteria bacterium]
MRRALAACFLLAGAVSLCAARTALDLQVRSEGSGVGDPLHLSIQFAPADLETIPVNGQVYTLITMEDAGLIGEPGRPDLPAIHRLLELPDHSDVQVRVVGGESHVIGNVLPMPVQDQLHNEAEVPQPWLQDQALYGEDAWYPSYNVLLDEPALVRNHRVAKLSVFPVQVNAFTGETRVWTSMELDVTFDGVNPVNQREWQLPASARVLEAELANAIVNPRQSDSTLDAVWSDPGKMPGKYLVFAPTAALTNQRLLDLLQWKRQRGHTVVIESSSGILSNAVSIKNRITTEYNSDEPVKFVMLVGDTDGSYAVAADGTSGYDNYYTRIEGTDILGDVAVGRLSVDNATQLTTVCNKILTYEQNPYVTNPSWLQHAGLVVGSSACYLSMRQVSRNIASGLVSIRGYNDIDTLWCSSSTPVPGLFNAGMSFYNYRGWIGMEGLSGSTIEALTQGPRTPVATIFTCSTGDFVGGDDLTENFFRGGNATTPGAAVACMGYATASTHTRYNNVMAVGFYHAFLQGDVPEVGSCLVHSKYELYMTLPAGDQQAVNFANWGNLMGDPGMRMWGGLLNELEFTVPSSISDGAGFLEFDVSIDGEPAEGIIVAAWQAGGAGDYQSVTMSDENGHVWLDLDGVSDGPMTLTVSHHRARPVQQVVTVGPQSVDPTLATWNVNGGEALPGVVAQPFEFTFSNAGSGALTGISMDLEMDPMYGSITGTDLTSADLPAGNTSAAVTGGTISPAADLMDGDTIPVIIHLSSNEGSADFLARVTVAGPSILPTAQTYPMGVWLPASSRSLQVVLQNSGSMAAEAPTVTLVSDAEDFVVVTSGAQTGSDIAPSASGTFSFNVDITQDALVGMNLPLHLEIAANTVVMQRVDLLVPVGNPGQNDPTGPDEYGYWAYEDEDNTYAQAPTFNWVEISPVAGGPGTLVPLSDEGDEQDDMVRVTMPFGFTYYGEYYTQAYISSNGFLAFADMGTLYETDFRNHYLPSGQGPDAMIAPMWDDHLTTGSGNVYTWFDAPAHRWVVEWYNVNANQSGGPNTFQVILYDPNFYPTGTGDGEFMFQYQVWNDNQSAGTDFPYCTVGMKDHTSFQGMTLKHYNILNPTMHSIGAGTAVLFTTTINGVLTPPSLNFDPAGLTVNLVQGESTTADYEIGNVGEVTMLYDLWLTFDARDSGGPDSYGYEWLDSNEDLGPEFNWVDEADATPVTFAHNDSTAGWFDLGFDFYLYGTPYDRVRISPNGFLSFSSWSGAWSNQELPTSLAPENSVLVWWDDLRPVDDTEGYCSWYTNNQDSLVVSWTGVPHYNPGANGGPFTFQAILRANGDITLQYQSVGSGHSGTAGLQGADGDTGIGVFHNQVIETPYAVRISPPAWAVLGSESGVVVGGSSVMIPVAFSSTAGYELPAGEYNASLHIATNDPDASEVVVPLQMIVDGVDVDENPTLPLTTRLAGNYPNPFNPTTRISLDLAQSGRVQLVVFNMLGQRVDTLLDSPLEAGSHSLDWDASHLPSGMYLLEMKAGSVTDRQKLMLVK